MPHSLNRRQWMTCGAAALAAFAGCGTILHPERRGQPAGRLDAGVVLLDGIGLLLFLVPGVIAFAVDFSSGAIYLPPSQFSDQGESRDLETIQLAPEELTRANVEREVSMHAGREIRLRPGQYETRGLPDLAQFWPATDALLAETSSSDERELKAMRCQSP